MDVNENDLNEYISKQILSEAFIPVVEEQLVSTLEETKATALHFGFPAGIEVSFDRLQAAMNGKAKVLVQRQVKGKIEMMAGFVRDH